MRQHDFYGTSSAFYEGVERNEIRGGKIGRKFLDPTDPVDAMKDDQVRETLHKMGIDTRGFTAAGCRLQLRMNSQRASTNLDRAWYEMHPDVNSLQHTVWKLEEDNKHLAHENDALRRALHEKDSEHDALKRANEIIEIQRKDYKKLEEDYKRLQDAPVAPDNSDEVKDLKKKIEQLKDENKSQEKTISQGEKTLRELEEENADLRRQMAKMSKKHSQASLEELGLGNEFRFGRRVYKCLVGNNGIGYRNTPVLSDKNPDGCGPVAPECVIADAMVQGPECMFIHDAKGWLPLLDPNCTFPTMQHMGREEDLKHTFDQPGGLDMADGDNKLSPQFRASQNSKQANSPQFFSGSPAGLPNPSP
jgi:regulator of replication initiation timing